MITKRKNFKEIESFSEFLDNGYRFINCCFQSIDFRSADINWRRIHLEKCVFLGGDISDEDKKYLSHRGNIFFPEYTGLPYQAYRNNLYTWQELYTPSSKPGISTIDEEIYLHFTAHRYESNILEALFQRIHDHSIDDALFELLGARTDGSFQQRAIGMMGGHSTNRSDPYFKKVAILAQKLAHKGYLIASGGGPGIMEAANLGAYFGAYDEKDLDHALDILHSDKHYSDESYLQDAINVIEAYPNGLLNLAIPTWFYGHEPSNLFASHIAKYFSNSIREDILLAISLHGIIFAPGSAGTIQEIFMDLSQNHYGTFGYYSPMVFLGSDFYVKNSGIFPIIQRFAEGRSYADLITVEDDLARIVDFIDSHPPRTT